MNSYVIKVYHWFSKGKILFKDFLNNIWKTLKNHVIIFWLNYAKWEFFYSVTTKSSTYPAFESQFYTYFNDFQVLWDEKNVRDYWTNAVVWEIKLNNRWFYPFKIDETDSTDFIYSIYRWFDNFDVINDKIWLFVQLTPIEERSVIFYVKSLFLFLFFRIWLALQFFKYIFNFKIEKDWKKIWNEYFKNKLNKELFSVKVFIVAKSQNKDIAYGRIKSVFNNFLIFNNYPLNEFELKVHMDWIDINAIKNWYWNFSKYLMTWTEISNFFHFPSNPKNETSLLKWSAKKLALPIWVPTFDSNIKDNNIVPKNYPENINILWISDYRSIKVPVWIYDEDRLRHLYVIWKTWVWKSKFLVSLVIDDIKQNKWVWIIDPHGDLIEEILMHIPSERKDDVIIFDPTDEKYPFSLNPLDIKENESKQILAKWFIDIFKKYFWANRNPKLEHVLRMTFLALLDKPWATLFDIIRALTDKDFRYDMIENIADDVVRNFWTNEFASWSQQFNTEAIMPILNKVAQLLSIESIKNIFWSKENKLDFRSVLDEKKILLIKLPKWKLQDEIMWFLWAMFVTKIYQAAMSRQWMSKSQRVPFFLYIDEFHNFSTDTFNEILSEARKYGLWLTIAHQFMKQIPSNISDAIFWNVWTLACFRISADDAIYVKNHFSPFLDGFDLANLNQREFYSKMIVNWEVKDPFSLKTLYIPDIDFDPKHIGQLYEVSRAKYCTTVEEKKKIIEATQKDVIEKIEEFVEPLI